MASRTISRGCTSTWLRVPEKGGYVSTPGSDYLKDHHKDLALLSVNWLCKNSRVIEVTSAAFSTSRH
jgi:hypothetical protein